MSQNPKPRRLTPCHRHPDLKTTTGLCAPCLQERLTLLNPSTSSSTTTAPIPELRRCKTFSEKNRNAAILEPRRRSCDVRGRNSLSSLFDNDEDGGGKVETMNLGLTCPVPVVKEEEEIDDDDDDESVPEAKIEIARVSNYRNEGEFDFEDGKTMKEFIDLELESISKPSSNNKKDLKEIAGSFLIAASVFSKKLRKWRSKHECSRRDGGNRGGKCNGGGDVNRVVGVSLGEMRIENLRGRRLSCTQSEVGDYGRASIDCGAFGRKLCDTDPRGSIDYGRASIDCGTFGRKSCDSEDPRFSIDLGRNSVDGGRVSVDESKSEFVNVPKSEFDAHRASWDGYLVGGGGGRSILSHRGATPVVSVIENAMATVYGFDNRVLSEGKVKMENGDEKDSVKMQRKGFDRCSSVKREMVGMPEDGEVKGLSNARVSPAAIGIFNGTKLLITEKELNEWRLNSVKDDSSESFETASKDLASVSSSSNGKDYKKCRQWSKLWNFWGLLHRKKGGKCSDEDELARASPDNTARNGSRGTLVRSHSSTSSRGSSSVVGSSSGTTSRVDSKAIIRRRHDDVLERNRSASSRYSPNQLDNGLLRFYLTPLRSRRRNKLGKSRLKKSHSLARSVLKLY